MSVSDLNTALAEAYDNRNVLQYQFGDPQAAMTDLGQAALFQAQGDHQGYQQTLYVLQQMQQGSEQTPCARCNPRC